MTDLTTRLDVDMGKDNTQRIAELIQALVPEGSVFTIIREMEDFGDFARFEGIAQFTADGVTVGKTSGRPSGTITLSICHKGGAHLYTIESRLNHVMFEYEPNVITECNEQASILKFTWLSREGMHGRRNVLAIMVVKTPEMA